ncbi:DZANK1 [Bugula neritina]|uniref:DZANK1 n=1 Tax=Bugula neritina TaxID=10212 RepID=A0A7J7JEU6_BUGNE|nr:DZANK1 [Bugula neritina]
MTAGSIIVPTIIPLRPPAPGRPKHLIDSSTRIEIKSDSPNVDIYYTMDGEKPNPFAALGTDRSTFKYRGPFTLPEGKLTVKAMATSRDGVRQSYVNTKNFEVSYAKQEVTFIQEDDDKAFQKDLIKEKNKRLAPPSYRNAWNEDTMDQLEANMTDMRVGGSNRRTGPTSARFTSNRYSQQSENKYTNGDFENSRRPAAPSPHRQTMRLQKKTDFLRCTYCFADRPSDPYARFCQTCGNAVPPLPTSRLSPPEPGENTLPVHARAVQTKDSAPPAPVASGQERECSSCHRVNNPDARFCDWCGAKPVPQGVPMTCSRCGATNNLYAAFCASCGVSIGAPNREVYNSTLTPNSSAKYTGLLPQLRIPPH